MSTRMNPTTIMTATPTETRGIARALPDAVGAAVLALSLIVGACAADRPLRDWADQDLAQQVRAYRAQGRLPATKAPPAAGHARAPSDADPAPQRAGPAWFVAEAIEHNAELRAARQRVAAAHEKVPQARALPDPMATLTVGELAQTAAGQVDAIIGLQQTLPAPGTLDARAQVARQQAKEAIAELAQTTLRIEAEVHKAYWSYDAAAAEAAVLEQSRMLLEQVREATEARVRVAAGSQADLLRISRRLAALDNRLTTIGQRRRTAAAMLNQLLSRPADAPLPGPTARSAEGPPGDDESPRDRTTLIRAATQTHPAVRLAQAQTATATARLDLARAERRPGFMVGLQYGIVGESGLAPSANGDDQLAATLGLSIPLWTGQYDAAEREAWHGMGASIASVIAAQDRAAFEVDDAMARIEAGRDQLDRLHDRMMPDAEQTIQVTLTAYQNDELSQLQLLDDWQALLDDQLQAVRINAEVQRARADLARALGRSDAAADDDDDDARPTPKPTP